MHLMHDMHGVICFCAIFRLPKFWEIWRPGLLMDVDLKCLPSKKKKIPQLPGFCL